MQVIITDHGQLRSRVFTIRPLRLVLWLLVVPAVVGAALALHQHPPTDTATVAEAPVLEVQEETVPETVPISRMEAVIEEEFAQRDRFLRENLDAMARRLGEMQAKLVQLQAIGDRLSGMAGLKPQETRALEAPPGRGGVLIDSGSLTLDELSSAMLALEDATQHHADIFTVIEARLFEQKLQAMMVPNQRPVNDGYVGSGFGFRIDPITGRRALHTGLDFAADKGTPILAAAAGVVVAAEYHQAYGNMVDIDHGNGLVTRYAHASALTVAKGDLVKRGQLIAKVGSTGRSTGPHLHFEVLVEGRPQNPAKFLAGMSGSRTAAKRPRP